MEAKLSLGYKMSSVGTYLSLTTALLGEKISQLYYIIHLLGWGLKFLKC